MCTSSKKVTWFLQIEGTTVNQYGTKIPRMIDWTEELSHPASLRKIGIAMRQKAKAEELTEWSLIHLQCLGR